ncbi:hypothetical protein BH11PAT4_BH11PAT4_5100 [soil metagenome]
MYDETHPDYSHKVGKDIAREHLLHRLVAGSAFIFALCILPVAQYFLVQSRTETAQTQEQGQVAGVSTDSSPNPEVFAAVATPEALPTTQAECDAKEAKDLADLQRFIDGKKKAMLTNYEVTVQPYRYALAAIDPKSNDAASERAELTALIDDAYQPYLQELATIEQLVVEEKAKITSTICPAP